MAPKCHQLANSTAFGLKAVLGFLLSLEETQQLERLGSWCSEYPQRFSSVTKGGSGVRVETFGRFLVIHKAWGSISPVNTTAVTFQCDIKAWGRGEDGG